MSQRPPVDRQRIEIFLQELGRRFRHPGRVYLVGGTTMVYEGFRGYTIDIDLAFEVSKEWHANFIDTVRNLKDELAVKVVEASPGDFIPLPTGHQERSVPWAVWSTGCFSF